MLQVVEWLAHHDVPVGSFNANLGRSFLVEKMPICQKLNSNSQSSQRPIKGSFFTVLHFCLRPSAKDQGIT